MRTFIHRHQARLIGVLNGFDRLVFRGHLLGLIREGGLFHFLCQAGVRLLDFKDYVVEVSERLKAASLQAAEAQGRPIRYLASPRTDKEALARRLLAEQPVATGLICAFTAVEPCQSFEYHRSPDRAARGLKLRPRKCLHVYQYYRHPVFGFCSARIQTWFPFNVQICLNGREWLATSLARQGAAFRRDDNCVFWAADVAQAQRLLDRQGARDWPRLLTGFARRLHPLHRQLFAPCPQDYYWSAYQTEWATDVLFRTPAALAQIYPALTRHATTHFQSPDVMRFLGRKAHGHFLGEIVSSFKHRPEGVRVKHWVKGNSIKMYDKAGSVLRVETTIGNPGEFTVFRPRHAAPRGPWAWQPMRKGVADLHRRAVVSQQANARYLDALAAVDDTTPLAAVLDQVGKPTTARGRRVRALRIGEPADVALLQAIARGEFATAGVRNRDLQALLAPLPANASDADRRRRSARVSRQLRLLRAHGILTKVPKSHRYRITPRGALLTAAVTAMRGASVKRLLEIAA